LFGDNQRLYREIAVTKIQPLIAVLILSLESAVQAAVPNINIEDTVVKMPQA